MKIFLTGKDGQLGHALSKTLKGMGALTVVGRKECDLANLSEIEAALDQAQPNLIVNAAAYTNVEKAEDEFSLACVVNGEAPARIARWAMKHRARLIHFSTDYIFSGAGATPWKENDTPQPLNAYGRSKLLGEENIEALLDEAMIFRTSWVYASRGKNFFLRMLELGRERETLQVVNDQVGAPTTADMLARAVAQILTQPFQRGIYNLTCTGETSWHGFALAIFEEARKKGMSLKVQDVQAISSSVFPARAKRPHNSRLDLTKVQQTFHLALPNWQDELRALFQTPL